MKRSELDAIKARCNAATLGPWKRVLEDNMHLVFRQDGDGCMGELFRHNDAEFIAHAREDIPRLVAEVEQLRAALQKAVDAWSGSPGKLIAAMDEAGALLER